MTEFRFNHPTLPLTSRINSRCWYMYRRLHGWIKNLCRWEYRSAFLIYQPVFLYLIYLTIRYRSLSAPFYVNPGLRLSGFSGCSKSETLNVLPESAPVACYTKIEPGTRQSRFQGIKTFMTDHRLAYPVVLKPDRGNRGRGVAVVNSDEEVWSYLAEKNSPLIAQQYLKGKEFGLFYYRAPDQDTGEIFSITCKEPVRVIGDGKHTLRQLILDHPSASPMAAVHFKKHKDRLNETPVKNETVNIVTIGTHSRGAVFSDGEHLISKTLRDEINKFCSPSREFCFGRFDVIAPSAHSLSESGKFKIVELNGITSESTNIYDRNNSYRDAIRILCRQWKLAFEIGLKNRKDQNQIPLRQIITGILELQKNSREIEQSSKSLY